MTDLHIFGSRTLTGSFLKENLFLEKNIKSYFYSRQSKGMIHFDFNNIGHLNIFKSSKKSLAFVSLAPIWLFKKLILKIEKDNPEILKKTKFMLICSSTSIETKKYAFSNYDKILSRKIIDAECNLLKIANKFNIKVIIVRPTMIFGENENYKDKNISIIKRLIKILPLIVLPKETGLRQPIHAGSLAAFLMNLIKKNINLKNSTNKLTIYNIGGDNEISYFEIIEIIKNKYSGDKFIKLPLILKIPNRLFFFLISPILICSPKFFESLLRVTVNLSNFIKVSTELGVIKKQFKDLV